MPCDPNQNSLQPVSIPGTPIPGFGIPFSPITPPLPFDFPDGFPEDILDFINSLQALFPSITFKPNLDDLTNSILKAISNILSQIAPFIGFYRFIQALLNMVLCIIEVLCSIPNPFRMARAMKRLFKRCLPPLLNLMPWLALLAMLIALLLLILALIQYIIERLLAFLREIIENLIVLSEGLTLQNEDATIAAAQKIAQLLCLIDNLLAILVAVAILIQVFQELAGIQGRTVCGRGGDTFGDDVGCCDEPVCPSFIGDNESLDGTQGELFYYNAILPDEDVLSGGLIPRGAFNLPPLRAESWQFVDQNTNQVFSFRQIIDPIADNSIPNPTQNIFFPDGVTYASDANVSKLPYSLEMTFKDFDPSVFHSSDTFGPRDFVIKDIVVNKPYVGVKSFDNSRDLSNTSGTLPISGGKVFEEDGYTPYLVNGEQATLQTFVHMDPNSDTELPSFDDGYSIPDVEFSLDINHEILMDHGLITLGCLPDLALESTIVNARASSVGLESVLSRIGSLPNITAAQECAAASLAKFRSNVSPDGAATFEQEVLVCLNGLTEEVKDSILDLILNGVSVFESTLEIDEDVQFITRPIKATVELKDAGGTNIASNLPEDIAADVAANLVGSVTFGNISNFIYDGYSQFNADITSSIPGDGILTAAFNNNIFSRVLNSDNDNVPSVIEEVQIPFTFIGTDVISTTSGAEDEDALPRRDEIDVSRS